jgi:type IV secretion system protein VirB9
VAKRWISKFQKPHLDGDGVEHFVAGKGQVFVVTAVEHITDIALAPGEVIVPPLHIGDADEWKLHPAQSGSGNKATEHVLVKPSDAGLSTNLVIETNKRTISVELTSRRADYMPLVALDLSDNDDNEWATAAANVGAVLTDARPGAAAASNSPCDQMPIVPPSQFHITGDNVPWRPMQAYIVATPVGNKTCVDFAGDIGSGELPAMLALADDGGWFSGPTKKIVNVRYVHRRFIADEQLSRFILVDGVGGSQKSVTIARVQP